jgi:hypothetical protein
VERISPVSAGDFPQSLLERLIPASVAVEQGDSVAWMQTIGAIDPDCKLWDSIVPDAAALIYMSRQAKHLDMLISACDPKKGAEDKQRMLRRIAVGAMQSCDIAAPLMVEVSTHRAGKDAPVPPRFIECLAREKKNEARSLANEASRLLTPTSKTADIRQIWQMSQTLRDSGLTEEAKPWAEKAVRFATEPDKQEEKERDTIQQFNNDVLKLEILAATDKNKHDAFIAQLAKKAEAFNGVSQNFSDGWAALRYVYAKQADRKPEEACAIDETDLKTVRDVILMSAGHPEKNPSVVATLFLPLFDRCKIALDDELIAEILRIVSGNNASADRARYVAMTAPLQKNLRRAMATAETAALPSEILKGYVASIDRHRPSTHKQADYEYRPIRYVPVSSSTAEVRR